MGPCGSRHRGEAVNHDVIVSVFFQDVSKEALEVSDEDRGADHAVDDPRRSFEKITTGSVQHIKERYNSAVQVDEKKVAHTKVPPQSESLKAIEGTEGTGLQQMMERYQSALQTDEEKLRQRREERRSFEKLQGTGLKAAGRTGFSVAMEQDNEKRGAASPDTRGDAADLFALVSRVEAGDPSLDVLDLSEHRQFMWLSESQKLRVLTQISNGRRLRELSLTSLALNLALIEPIAAAVRSHTGLEKLAVERNGLNEAALVLLADAVADQCAAHIPIRALCPKPARRSAATRS